jgi:hypothetical protein
MAATRKLGDVIPEKRKSLRRSMRHTAQFKQLCQANCGDGILRFPRIEPGHNNRERRWRVP